MFPFFISIMVLFTMALYYVYRTAILTALGERPHSRTTVLLLGGRPIRLKAIVEPVLVVAGSLSVDYLAIYLWSLGHFLGYQLITAGMVAMAFGLVLVAITELRRGARPISSGAKST